MSESWESKNLGDICYVLDSQRKPITKGKRVPGDIPYYGASGIVDHVKDYIFDEELLLVSEDGANLLARKYPIAFSVSGKTWVNNHAHVLRFDSRITQYFVEYYLNSISLEDYISGMAQPKLNQTKLNSIPIPFPSIQKQENIVSFLDKSLELINYAKLNFEKNISNAEELFQAELSQLFCQSSKGWENKSLGDKKLLSFEDGDRGKNYPKISDFKDEGYCVFLNTGNVRDNGFKFSKLSYISEEKDALLRKGKLRRGDVILTTRGTIGNIGLYNDEVPYENIRINSGMVILRANQEVILPEYLFNLFRSSIIKQQIKIKTSGAAQPQLPIKTLVTFTAPVCQCLKEQQRIVDLISELEKLVNDLIINYKNNLINLENLKQSILQKAFSDKLIGS